MNLIMFTAGYIAGVILSWVHRKMRSKKPHKSVTVSTPISWHPGYTPKPIWEQQKNVEYLNQRSMN